MAQNVIGMKNTFANNSLAATWLLTGSVFGAATLSADSWKTEKRERMNNSKFGLCKITPWASMSPVHP